MTLKRVERIPQRVFVAEAENPGFLRFNNPAFSCGKAPMSLEQRCQPALFIEAGERPRVYPNLGGIENFVPFAALADLLLRREG